ncbi:MAG: isovaleryl-CoA dehydrogenase [Lysobacteraceae bacterium]
MPELQPFTTHTVDNQPPELLQLNLFDSDPVLQRHLAAQGGDWGSEHLSRYGALAGGELAEQSTLANRNRPELHTHDRFGHRIDEVRFHPAYHRLMSAAMEHEVHAFAWNRRDREGAQVVRAALAFLHNQADAGTSCPLTMTAAAVPALMAEPRIAETWLPRITSRYYDPSLQPAEHKRGCTIGMGMTEKQGGSDVRANRTRATRQGDGSYRLIGHKWFFSAPMCDAFLVLAQADEGLTCFLLPRWCPNGGRNAIRIQRLKDKLGDHSNASSEVEFENAYAERVGDEGRGVATILQMVALTRLDCMLGSAGLMRMALVQAIHHARHRSAFGKRLIEQPLMCSVLADLALESEASTALFLRIARAVDASECDPAENALARVGTAIGKFWVCKRTPAMVNEAQECLGGAGYVEESMLPRLFRQSPLNSIWEGSGNVQCLDVLRALVKQPECRDALLAEINAAKGEQTALDSLHDNLERALSKPIDETEARHYVEGMALGLQASLLLRHSADGIGAAFCEARLGEGRGLVFGSTNTRWPSTMIDDAFPDTRARTRGSSQS